MAELTARETQNRDLLRARDAIDRRWAEPIDVEALARIANCSRAHFIRVFAGAFGETPHRYLQRRRIERAMAMLRERPDLSVTEISLEVGFASLGSFSRTFAAIVDASPSEYRRRIHDDPGRRRVPACWGMHYDRPVLPGAGLCGTAAASREVGHFRRRRGRAAGVAWRPCSTPSRTPTSGSSIRTRRSTSTSASSGSRSARMSTSATCAG